MGAWGRAEDPHPVPVPPEGSPRDRPDPQPPDPQPRRPRALSRREGRSSMGRSPRPEPGAPPPPRRTVTHPGRHPGPPGADGLSGRHLLAAGFPVHAPLTPWRWVQPPSLARQSAQGSPAPPRVWGRAKAGPLRHAWDSPEAVAVAVASQARLGTPTAPSRAPGDCLSVKARHGNAKSNPYFSSLCILGRVT